MPSRIEHPRTGDGESLTSLFQLLDFCKRGLKILCSTEYADQSLHNFLKVTVQSVRIFSVFTLKRCQQLTLRVFDLSGIEHGCASTLCVLGRSQSGAATEDQ